MRLLGWIKEMAWMLGLAGGLVALTLFAFFQLPGMVVSPEDLRQPVAAPRGLARPTAPTAVDLVQARNGARTAGVALLAGFASALAAGFAGRTFYLTRRSQLDAKVKTALDQLAEGPSVLRVAAITTLERLALEYPTRHREIMNVLATFVREQRRAITDEIPPGVQEACTAIAARRVRDDPELKLNLANADLRNVTFDGAPLCGATLLAAQLEGTLLRGSDLRGATLKNAAASSARFDNADLRGALLNDANLDGATLDGANAQGASFEDTRLNRTYMRATDLRLATGLRVEGTDVGGAVTTTQTQLPHAQRDDEPRRRFRRQAP